MTEEEILVLKSIYCLENEISIAGSLSRLSHIYCFKLNNASKLGSEPLPDVNLENGKNRTWKDWYLRRFELGRFGPGKIRSQEIQENCWRCDICSVETISNFRKSNSRSETSREITINMKCDHDGGILPLRLALFTTEGYPNTPPEVSLISSDIQREHLSVLKKDINKLCQKLAGNSMLLEVTSFIQEEVSTMELNSGYLSIKDTCSTDDDLWTMLLHLDHMRSKDKYIKTVEKMASEFALCGRLLFQRKNILILLQGGHTNLKEYVSKHRSINIDVDSRGQSCKERMLSVLYEEKKHHSQKSFTDFKVEEVNTADELKRLFHDYDLSHLYDSHIK